MEVDNAGNGLRGLRATPSPELLELVSERYGFDRREEARDLGGSSNLNLLFTDGDRRCVARIYRPYVNASRLNAIQLVRRELAHRAIPCAEVVPTRDGEPWTVIDGRLVEVEVFVER